MAALLRLSKKLLWLSKNLKLLRLKAALMRGRSQHRLSCPKNFELSKKIHAQTAVVQKVALELCGRNHFLCLLRRMIHVPQIKSRCCWVGLASALGICAAAATTRTASADIISTVGLTW